MDRRVTRGISLGIVSTTALYVLGFIWQYTYLGAITDHLGWIKIVTTDYIYLGVMSIIFTYPAGPFAIAAVTFILIYSGLMHEFIKFSWRHVGYHYREKLWFFFNSFKGDTEVFYRRVKKFALYLGLLIMVMNVPLKISESARTNLAARLATGPVDLLVKNNGSKYKGKILYASNDQYYFYVFESGIDYTNGRLLLVNKDISDLYLKWNENSKERVDNIIREKLKEE